MVNGWLAFYNAHKEADEFSKKIEKEGGLTKKEVKEVKEAGKTSSGDWDPLQYVLNRNEKLDKTYPVGGLPDRYKSEIDFVLKSYTPESTLTNYTEFGNDFAKALSEDNSGKLRELRADYIWNPMKYEHPFAWAKHGMLYNLLRPLGRLIKYGRMDDKKFEDHLKSERDKWKVKAAKKKAAEEARMYPVLNPMGQVVAYMGMPKDGAAPTFISPQAYSAAQAGQPGVAYAPVPLAP